MNICIYGASSNAIDPFYLDETEKLGRSMSRRSHTLVFGGGNTGLMGAAARGMAENQGKILGVSPHFFHRDDILYHQCTELILTDTMRQRKQKMEDLADGFIMLPGGIGTFEEFFEILTLKQLRQHWKPIAIWNGKGYFNPMLELLSHAVDENFMKPACLTLFSVFEEIEPMLDYLENYAEDMPEDHRFRNV